MSMGKDPQAFRTISEVSEAVGVPQHILRFWETRFPQLKPLKRGGNRRYYRPADVELAAALHALLHRDGFSVKGVQKLFADHDVAGVIAIAAGGARPAAEAPHPDPAGADTAALLSRLVAIRDRLAAAAARG